MYKSKLQICVEILCALASDGPLNLIDLRNKVELDVAHLEPHLELLKNRDLVREQILGENKNLYAVTERGLTVIKVIGPIIQEAHKIRMHDLEAVSTVLSGAGY
jgi:predicted transcriptional regulator